MRKIKDKETDKGEAYRPLGKKIQEKLARTPICIAVSVIAGIVVFLLENVCIQLVSTGLDFLKNLSQTGSINFELPNVMYFDVSKYWLFYIIAFVIAVAFALRLFYKMKLNFTALNQNQKGSRSWASIKELDKQYRKIPDKEKEYSGKPGFPVSRYKDEIYIDESPVNNLIIGTTRSGKGELFVFPIIDIYSRPKLVENKASLIISDPKGELVATSKDTLEKRGYNIQIFDINSFKGMSYNPLEIIKNEYISGDRDDAITLADTLAHILFNDPTAKDKVWQDWSKALCEALILATVIDCCQKADEASEPEEKEEWYNKINMYSITRLLTDYGIIDDKGGSQLDEFFKSRENGDIAKVKYSSILMAQKETKGSIFASTLAVLTKFTASNIAKMTATNSLNLTSVGFDTEKPTAVFMVIPDNDTSCHFLVTMFISQLYFMLVKEGKKSGYGGKCKREVVFLLDEFGNIVAIPEMSNILNVCLGRNIRFDLIIQAYSQIDRLYGKDSAKEITGACANQVYILTTEHDTADRFSRLIGNETITIRSRTGDPLSLNKSFTEHVDTRPLLNPNELMELKPGETIICRVIKRQDLHNKKVSPNPIFNRGKTIMKHRYEYLYDTFPTDGKVSLGDVLPIQSPFKSLILENYIYTPDFIKRTKSNDDVCVMNLLNSASDLVSNLKKNVFSKFDLDKTEIALLTITQLDQILQEAYEKNYIDGKNYQELSTGVSQIIHANAQKIQEGR